MLLPFILIVGLWGVLLLPGVLGDMRSRPVASTRRFQESTAILAAVSTTDQGRSMLAQRRASARRRQTLLLLGTSAFATLAMAVATGVVWWLVLTCLVDLALGGFVGALLTAKRNHPPTSADVIQLRSNEVLAEAVIESTSVRVLASAR
ncbi:MAG: hypothetical protein IIC71_03380 [Acidobacteria bacterium]|nr:hypothetical protein [Acidobacteriota bacterium]